jgi:Tfp pilus assembly protein PilN
MNAPVLRLDFVPPSRRGGRLGFALALAGVLCLGAALWRLHALSAERAGLELRRDAALEAARRHLAAGRDAAGQGAARTAAALGVPWSQLLAELERAGRERRDDVALLAIEPDQEKHRVRITAEARSLPSALAYVEQLRHTKVLHYPMLDSHELRTEDRDHPVRFQMSADWVDGS